MKRTRKRKKTESAYIVPMGGFFTNPPEHCPHKTHIFHHDYTDMTICHFYCENVCQEYITYREERDKRRKRKEPEPPPPVKVSPKKRERTIKKRKRRIIKHESARH